jgi:catechol 2,3-dioxygenase-like lactoylglutathione lyase family enzyme
MSAVSIGVSDVGRARRFYSEGLGLPERAESNERRVFYDLKGGWLCIFQREILAQLATVPAEGSGFTGVVLSHNVGEEGQVDEVVAEALKAGGSLVKQAESNGSVRVAYFADPDGYLWEVAWMPQWPELSE